MTSPPLQLRCRDLAAYEDLCADLGIPEDAFGFHDWDDLDEPCDCAAEHQLPVDEGLWDAQARHDHNARLDERNRRCRERTALQGQGFVLVVCCRCRYRAGANDVTLIKAGLAIAVAERARLDRAAEREAEADQPCGSEESLCFALARSLDLVAAGHPIQEVNRAGRVLRRESYP